MYFLFGSVNYGGVDIVTDIGFNSSELAGILRVYYNEGFDTSADILKFLEYYASIVEAQDFTWIMGIHNLTGNITERFKVRVKYAVTVV